MANYGWEGSRSGVVVAPVGKRLELKTEPQFLKVSEGLQKRPSSTAGARR